MMNSVQSVALILVDGMRPDGLIAATTPTIDRLAAEGAATYNARTVMPSATLPCHMSLFHSVPPERHGINTNVYTPQVKPVPSLLEVIQESGGPTAAFYNWEELRDIARPGALTASFYLQITGFKDGRSDAEIAELAASWLGDNPFTFAFIYLGYTDLAGHAFGWMSTEYLSAVANADSCIARLLVSLPGDCAVIVTSDHGGHEYTHGTDSDEDMTIPLILKGPGIPAGCQIERPVNILDVAPTILRMLGISQPEAWWGKSIRF